MAIWNRKRIDKAAPIAPAGANVTQFSQEQLNALQSQPYSTGNFEPLGRNPWIQSVPFSPSNPLFPAAINPLGDNGRPDPRRWEYPVAWNVFVTEQRLVPWKVLRSAADQIDLLRRCVEVTKSKIMGLDWDFTFTDSASESIAGGSSKDHVRAMQEARDKYQSEITRMRNFWQTPDRINGLGFKDWLGMMLEENLVLDAVAIYPHPDLKGDLHSLEILDGSTIKPLLDDRGMRPRAPLPAYQQILYGFPRGEFLATSDDPSQDGKFSSDELIYLRRNNRTWTPYGFSPVERSLPLADIYIKRQQWLRAEFTDGVMPDLMFMPDESFVSTPAMIQAYESILNDDLSGQIEQRRRARILPPGLTPVDNTGHSEKFNDTLDEYLIKGIVGHWGILPSEIGYTPKSGLGGAGHQAGEAESATQLGQEPLIKWLEQQISDICYKYLGCPRELEFRFDGGRATDTDTAAQRRDTEIKGAQRSINEARSELNLPLIDSPFADLPMIVTAAGTFFITPDGLQSATDIATAAKPEGAQEEQPLPPAPPVAPVDEEADTTQRQEVKAFLTWARKGNTTRDFEFKTLDAVHAAALNQAAKDADFDFIKSVTDVVLKKA